MELEFAFAFASEFTFEFAFEEVATTLTAWFKRGSLWLFRVVFVPPVTELRIIMYFRVMPLVTLCLEKC